MRRARAGSKLEAFTIEMSPLRGRIVGLISNSDKTGSGQEQDIKLPNHG